MVRSLMIALFLFSVGCRKKMCAQDPIQVMPTGFDTTELAEIIVKKYAKYGAFTNAIETRQISASNYIQLFGRMELRIDPEHDWTVELPLADKLFRISQMTRYNERNMTTGTGGIANRCVDGFFCIVNDSIVHNDTEWGQTVYQILVLKE